MACGIPVGDDLSEDERAVMLVLMKHGEYDESPCSVEWLGVDAHEALSAAPNGPSAVVAALLDTSWWDETTEQRHRAHQAAVEICAAAGLPVEEDQQ